MTNSVRVFAPAKINLFLHVGERRRDGFHVLQSLVVFVDVGDELRLSPARRFTLALDGPFAHALEDQADNLVLRAAQALGQGLGLDAGANIVLTKNLPVASGIGGGSADAAATLRGLVCLWRDFRDQIKLITCADAVAATVGSDVPVCASSVPSWMEGRGEIVTPAGILAHYPMVLVNPGAPVATADVFRALESRSGTSMDKPPNLHDKNALLQFLATTRNDLEVPASAIQPAIGDVLKILAAQPGALMVRMSGSGATCFALFEYEAASQAAAESIAAQRPGWWVRATRIAHNNIGAPQ